MPSAGLPPAVGTRGSSIERQRVVGPRAAYGSEGPRQPFLAITLLLIFVLKRGKHDAVRASAFAVALDSTVVRLLPKVLGVLL